MRALAPITVTGADLDVALVPDGISAAWTPGSVRVANQSRFALQCTLGADFHLLEPWTVDVWPVRSVTSMHVHPVKAEPLVPGVTSGTVWVTVAEAFESFPGTYPASVGAAIVSEQLLQAAVINLTNATSQNGNASVPAGTQSLSIVLVPNTGAGSCFLRVVGATSGQLLGMAIASAKQPARVIAAIDSSVDTSVNWTLTVNAGSTTAIVNPLTTPAPPPLIPGAPAGGLTFPLHPTNPAAITPAAPYILWTISHDATNPLALVLFGWSLTFDGETGNSCFASITATNAAIFQGPATNGTELWNRQLLSAAGTFTGPRNSEVTWRHPIVVAAQDPTTQDLSLEFTAPVAATQYNARGLINAGVVPWVPGLGTPVA